MQGYKKPEAPGREKQEKEKKEGKHQKAHVLIKLTRNKRNQALGAAWLQPLFLQQAFCELPEHCPNSPGFSNTEAIHSSGQVLLPSRLTGLLYFPVSTSGGYRGSFLGEAEVQQTCLELCAAKFRRARCTLRNRLLSLGD